MRIAVIGANGQLGFDLCRAVGEDKLIRVTHSDIEVSNRTNVDEVISREKPDAIINTAAFHKVDLCEDNPEKAFAINAVGAWNLARAAKENNAKYVFISTDYVFSGSKRTPYAEDDPVDPVNVYGVSKAAGEMLIKNLGGKYFIIRTAGLYGIHESGRGLNNVELMLKQGKENDVVKVAADRITTPTYTLELANTILELLKTDKYGTYHITNEGSCSWYEFAKKLYELEGVKTKLIPATSQEFTKAPRPKYSVLEKRNLKAAGLKTTKHWEKSLAEYLKERKTNNENNICN
jgi:dTDP-4-dehydrorhamnose reductase